MSFVIFDDILVTGKSDHEHLKNLGEVVSRMERYGIRLKQEECRFLQAPELVVSTLVTVLIPKTSTHS